MTADLLAALKKGKKNSLTRAQAEELYRDLKRNVTAMQAKKFAGQGGLSRYGAGGAAPAPVSAAAQKLAAAEAAEQSLSRSLRRSSQSSGAFGHYAAVGLVLFFAVTKVVLSALESSGFAAATSAEASINAPRPQPALFVPLNNAQPQGQTPAFSKEELTILTALDARRVEFEERSKRLDDREADLEKRDREFAARQTQLREMTETLKLERDKNEKKRNLQLDQLANVYGSMDPKEAAVLIEQLDVTIALSLLQRMPEKRIGQILALMNPQRALSITRMLSGTREG